VTEPLTLAAAFRAAAELRLPQVLVEECLLLVDRFSRAWTVALDQVQMSERRGGLCVETGGTAESVAALLSLEAGLAIRAELATG
jgi:hypothetical protein